jgi:hypothetical protein
MFCAMPTPWCAVARTLLLSSAVATFPACERANESSSRSDTRLPPAVGAVESLPPGSPAQRWDTTAGTILLVRDDSVTRAVFPTVMQLDSTAVLDEAVLRGVTADAVSAVGVAGSMRVEGFAAGDEECAVWPAVALASDSTREWTVAFQRGVAAPIVLRSIESLASADSARLAAQLARLAGLLPNDTARVFQGLPFVVRGAHRFTPVPGREAVVADIVRRVSLEANPREETLLIIAERDSGTTTWRVGYAERASGDEMRVEHSTPLAAVRLGASTTPTVVLERAGADWIAYALLQRQPDGMWRMSWESAHSGC